MALITVTKSVKHKKLFKGFQKTYVNFNEKRVLKQWSCNIIIVILRNLFYVYIIMFLRFLLNKWSFNGKILDLLVSSLFKNIYNLASHSEMSLLWSLLSNKTTHDMAIGECAVTWSHLWTSHNDSCHSGIVHYEFSCKLFFKNLN